MRTTIDGAGRLVVPKAIRDACGLEPGSDVEIRAVEGRVEIEPAPARCDAGAPWRVGGRGSSQAGREAHQSGKSTMRSMKCVDRGAVTECPSTFATPAASSPPLCSWHEHHDRTRGRNRGSRGIEARAGARGPLALGRLTRFLRGFPPPYRLRGADARSLLEANWAKTEIAHLTGLETWRALKVGSRSVRSHPRAHL